MVRWVGRASMAVLFTKSLTRHSLQDPPQVLDAVEPGGAEAVHRVDVEG